MFKGKDFNPDHLEELVGDIRKILNEPVTIQVEMVAQINKKGGSIAKPSNPSSVMKMRPAPDMERPYSVLWGWRYNQQVVKKLLIFCCRTIACLHEVKFSNSRE